MKLTHYAGRRYFSFLQYIQTGCEAHPVTYSVGNKGSILEGKAVRGMRSTTHLHLVLRLRLCGAVSLLLLYAFTAWRRTTLLFYSLQRFFKHRNEYCGVGLSPVPLQQTKSSALQHAVAR
jgi:hypothetical protein